jgi:hypothetical protein
MRKKRSNAIEFVIRDADALVGDGDLDDAIGVFFDADADPRTRWANTGLRWQ